ncbi:MAG: hypothetical protein HYS86_01490 [Candidatus Chisholmbacteria bacterium]|nr:hypothetical protein [Candidatus Chisholmbacteria bacterium]
MSELGGNFFEQSLTSQRDPLALHPFDDNLRVDSDFIAARERLGITRILLPIVTAATLAVIGGEGSIPSTITYQEASSQHPSALVGVHFRSEQLYTGDYDIGVVVGIGEATFGQRLLWNGGAGLKPNGTVISFAGKPIYDPSGLMQQ